MEWWAVGEERKLQIFPGKGASEWSSEVPSVDTCFVFAQKFFRIPQKVLQALWSYCQIRPWSRRRDSVPDSCASTSSIQSGFEACSCLLREITQYNSYDRDF
jgi:hypothetical protein